MSDRRLGSDLSTPSFPQFPAVVQAGNTLPYPFTLFSVVVGCPLQPRKREVGSGGLIIQPFPLGTGAGRQESWSGLPSHPFLPVRQPQLRSSGHHRISRKLPKCILGARRALPKSTRPAYYCTTVFYPNHLPLATRAAGQEFWTSPHQP